MGHWLEHNRSRRGGAYILGSCLGLSAALFGGCRGEDLYFDCEEQSARFLEVAESEGTLLESVPKGDPYPVAIKFSEDGLNRLLEGVVGSDVPFTGELPFVWFSGPGTLEFEATSDPVIELESLEGCSTCVQYSFDFNTVLIGIDEEPEGAGIGSVKFRVPIILREQSETSTVLIADYSNLRVQDLWLSAFGLVTEDHEALVGALGRFMEEKIQETYGETELLTLDSWEIGNGDVRLLARKLLVFPEEDTMALAMQSNLPLPAGGGLDITGEMPTGIPMVLDFDIAMLQAMIERMLTEGEIPRRYDEDGVPDEEGTYGVTFESLEGQPNGQALDSQFRVWRIADGYCGYALASMGIDVDLDDETSAITLSAGEVTVLSGQGSGAVAAEETQLVEDNQQVVETFREGVTDNLGTTLNYDALAIEGSSIIFETKARDVYEDHLEAWIDFFVVENP
ncbi:hypothetical protein G6O69_05125 [Pseudenhygromyxa sp. WMMC2535]|uniref:hypothetical protein n=1 Tax=Pseudenhygromyxa sp. WMMC2535 TaxID=2712867 RepID=UPI0015955614|nr:hypothetical protein [Pseudenhygromyxa sp. WMMC2535]NVB37202.1 hypothetical protein [Pseudenhygromyxa sp. WMMC2535]